MEALYSESSVLIRNIYVVILFYLIFLFRELAITKLFASSWNAYVGNYPCNMILFLPIPFLCFALYLVYNCRKFEVRFKTILSVSVEKLNAILK